MLNGIDVSYWQSDLNVNAVPCDFVICKATEGTGYVNKVCDKHYQQAKQHQKLLGTYHYAKGIDAIKEADFYVSNIKGYIGESIMCLDFEDKNVLSKGPSWAQNWLWRVHDLTGVWPLIYMSYSVAQNMDWHDVAQKCGLWLAKYPYKSSMGYEGCPKWNFGALKHFGNIAIWQYTSKGKLKGYNSFLDLDHAYMTREGWMKFAIGERGAGDSGTGSGSDISDSVSHLSTLDNDEYKVTIERK